MILVIRSILASLLLSVINVAVACDDKACEAAYISETLQYVHVHQKRADGSRNERVAYAKIRESRDRSLNEHKRNNALGRNR